MAAIPKPLSQEQVDLERPFPMACVRCGSKNLVRTTKNATSTFLGLVECTAQNCGYSDTIKNYRAAFLTLQREQRGG